jgi:hypothetical protein
MNAKAAFGESRGGFFVGARGRRIETARRDA